MKFSTSFDFELRKHIPRLFHAAERRAELFLSASPFFPLLLQYLFFVAVSALLFESELAASLKLGLAASLSLAFLISLYIQISRCKLLRVREARLEQRQRFSIRALRSLGLVVICSYLLRELYLAAIDFDLASIGALLFVGGESLFCLCICFYLFKPSRFRQTASLIVAWLSLLLLCAEALILSSFYSKAAGFGSYELHLFCVLPLLVLFDVLELRRRLRPD